MRVIAGRARGTQLVTPKGMNTRPTTDRIKETLFNMINNRLYDSRFLDLFSGSGAIGIEALSRGASFCTFVENESSAVDSIIQNLKKTRFYEQAEIIRLSAESALKRLSTKEAVPYDLVFMDPPYNNMYERDMLSILKGTNLIDENTTIIIEASIETPTAYIEELGYNIEKIKEYKTNKHVFVSLRNGGSIYEQGNLSGQL